MIIGLEGDGPETIVLINGLADDLTTWFGQVPDFLAAGYRVLLEGDSMGGAIVTLIAEQFPGHYKGAVAVGAASASLRFWREPSGIRAEVLRIEGDLAVEFE